MNIKVNGEMREVQEGTTMFDLISSLGLSERVMASALNMEIVKQDAWDKVVLHDGDTIELLDFVGGG
ncbi:sulfur carrier protein ThiS [Sulfuricurvum sp.]|uniref:sulfur carrier protein ThiS n=1 Tax=Sulfuricurvum sp. TaxID=2025608 RepID=UPI0019BFD1EB|nr:sulfur carrier protein ThiS [Sulfuricurvum sp.]MBD3805534.1 sulfur carrier protein ThiS [Sulfuricurvum sp.]